MFVLRARQVRPDFTLDAENAATVAELCRRLDGVPLALELAAAQLRVLTPSALLRRLGDRLDRSLDLTAGSMDLPARQRTLRATLEWSCSLLTEQERALLARLSVFASSWTVEGAEAVGGLDADDVLDTLSSLVVHSLVFAQRQHVDEPRFTMLDSVRVYAHEQLRERGELEPCLTRMTSYLRDFAAAAGPNLRGPENGAWANRVDSELGDLRQTMTRAVQADDPETVVALTAPLFNYWWNRGLLGEMRELAEEAAGLPSASRLSPGVSALLGWARGMFRVSVGQTEEAQPLLREVLEAACSLGDERLRAYALAGLGLARANGDADEAKKLLDEAVSAYRTLEDEWGLAFALSIRGQLALQDGDPAAAEAMHREGLVAAEHIANDHLRAQLLDQLGLDAMAVGDVAGARDHFAAAADVHALVLDQEGSAYCLDGFAAVSLARGHPDVSARLLGASAHARELVGVAVWPAMLPLANAMLAAVSASLDDTAFAEATADGARMRLNDALAYALASTPAEPPSA